MMLFPCPCCGHRVFDKPPRSYAFCPICGWQDDLSQLRFPRSKGANHIPLIDAQSNYAAFGVSEPQRQARVRAPLSDDLRDPAWRPLDPNSDRIEEAIPGTDYGLTYPADLTLLYYWRQR